MTWLDRLDQYINERAYVGFVVLVLIFLVLVGTMTYKILIMDQRVTSVVEFIILTKYPPADSENDPRVFVDPRKASVVFKSDTLDATVIRMQYGVTIKVVEPVSEVVEKLEEVRR